jgi:lysophospholipase L1-like esterase
MEALGLRMENMLEFLWQANPASVIILSTLLVNRDKDINSRVMDANDQFRKLTELKAREGKKIVLADMNNSRGPQLDDLVDGTHPDDYGYKKMAAIWFNAIRRAREKGFL